MIRRRILALVTAVAAVAVSVAFSTTTALHAQSGSAACLRINSGTYYATQCISAPFTSFTIAIDMCSNFRASTTEPAHGGGPMMAAGQFTDGGGRYEWDGLFTVDQLPDGNCY